MGLPKANSPLVFRRKIGGTMAPMSAATLLLKIAKQFLGGTMVPMRAITLLLKITKQFLGGVPRRGKVVRVIYNVECGMIFVGTRRAVSGKN